MSTKLKNLLVLIIPNIIMITLFLFVNLDCISEFFKYFLAISTIIPSALILLYGNKLHKILYKVLLLTCYACSFGLLIYVFLYSYDLLKYFSSITATKELILSKGAMGSVIFIFIQIAQVVFLPIPAIALLVVGILIYGMWQTAIYCTIGVLIGSYISFLFGKTFGYKFVSWVVGEAQVSKYTKVLKKHGKYILSLVFIFPFFPDDLFCMVAGISPMTFKEFFIITTIIRPISIFVMCFMGGGAIYSLNSVTGIIIFLSLIIIMLLICVIFLRKNKKIKALFSK